MTVVEILCHVVTLSFTNVHMLSDLDCWGVTEVRAKRKGGGGGCGNVTDGEGLLFSTLYRNGTLHLFTLNKLTLLLKLSIFFFLQSSCKYTVHNIVINIFVT